MNRRSACFTWFGGSVLNRNSSQNLIYGHFDYVFVVGSLFGILTELNGKVKVQGCQVRLRLALQSQCKMQDEEWRFKLNFNGRFLDSADSQLW